jgi:hypothetical protein
MATCALQKRSAYAWMHRAICAYFNGQPIPSLLLPPNGRRPFDSRCGGRLEQGKGRSK